MLDIEIKKDILELIKEGYKKRNTFTTHGEWFLAMCCPFCGLFQQVSGIKPFCSKCSENVLGGYLATKP